MLEYIKNEANMTLTENGAVTLESTGSECLDLFATIGALRRESDEEIVTRFIRAYSENADTAMKQRDLQNYAERFALSGKLMTKVGINFDSAVGNITDWRIA